MHEHSKNNLGDALLTQLLAKLFAINNSNRVIGEVKPASIHFPSLLVGVKDNKDIGQV